MNDYNYILAFHTPDNLTEESRIISSDTRSLVEFMKANVSFEYLYVEMYERCVLPISGLTYFRLFRRWDSIREFLEIMREYSLCVALEAHHQVLY